MDKRTKKILSFALASALISGVPISSHADTNECYTEDDYITYTVEDGDTLGNIATRYYGNAGYWEKIAEFNNMENPNKLSIGDTIKIPKPLTYDYENNTVVVNNDTVCVNEYEEDKTYTVKCGDTLYCIVRVQYGLTNQEAVDKLATYNNLCDPNRLSVGQVLLIPCKEKLMQVVQNDYTDEYNRQGEILYGKKCTPCNPCNPCDVYYVPAYLVQTGVQEYTVEVTQEYTVQVPQYEIRVQNDKCLSKTYHSCK